MSRVLTADAVASRPYASRLVSRLGMVLGSHAAVDVYAALAPPLIGVLQVRCNLTDAQAAMVIGLGSVSSGLSQPLSAWLSDRFDTRAFGAIGLLVAAVCLSCIGMADSLATLVTLYIVGMIGVGIYHPVGASTAGQLAEGIQGVRRSVGVSLFFVAGMVGGTTGALIARSLATGGDSGFDLLRYGLIPGAVLAAALFVMIRRVPHRHHASHLIRFADGESRQRWFMIAILYFGNAMRFTVNMALIYLIVRWAEAHIAASNPAFSIGQVAREGGRLASSIQAFLPIGMAIGGIGAGFLVRHGHEKAPLVWVPLLLSPFLMLFGVTNEWGAYALALLSGIGFAAMVPVTLSVAQRLLPHRTSLASGFMLGGAWALAFLGPVGSEWLLHRGWSLSETFTAVALVLAASGALSMALNRRLLLASCDDFSRHDAVV